MYFSTAKPVIGEAFFDRRMEMEQLLTAIESLKAGVPRYYALLGLRKVGKSSLIAELKRRSMSIGNVVVVVVDCYESCVEADTFFEDMATKVIDEFLIVSGHANRTGLLSGAKQEEATLTMTVGRVQALGIRSLEKGLLALLEVRKGGSRAPNRRDHYRVIVDLPEALASEIGITCVLVFDEFQECTKLNALKSIQTTIGDVCKFFRAAWQRQEQVAYLISGSEITLLSKIIHAENAPFFEHFNPMLVGEFSVPDARAMFGDLLSRSGYTMSDDLTNRLIDLTNGHPFYLQVLGEELCKATGQAAITEDIYKSVVQQTLFENAGRLYLYFAGLYAKHIKSSTSLEKTLVAVANGHEKVSEVAREIGQQAGVASSFISRLVDMDLLVKTDASYRFRDPVFRLWVAGTKSHLRSVIGPYTLGDAVERTIADKLGKEGFSLVYQSRASRGAFDLLAVLNSFMVGLQVKKAKKFPFYLPKEEVVNMADWGKQLGWLPVLCVYVDDASLYFFKLDTLTKREKTYRVDARSGNERLLSLVMETKTKTDTERIL